MQAELVALRRDYDKQSEMIARMSGQLDELVALANRGRGAFWMTLTVGGLVGGLIASMGDIFRLFKG